jgi:hypothetical protein
LAREGRLLETVVAATDPDSDGCSGEAGPCDSGTGGTARALDERRAWVNPQLSGKVAVISSSLNAGKPAALVAHTPTLAESLVQTRRAPNSWLGVDIGKRRRLRPTAYSLRHRGDCANFVLRSWVLEGSEDSEMW